VQIPIVHDPAALCPAWDRFIEDVFPNDCGALAWEVLGWLMVPDMGLKKAVLLLGEGDNGKSLWLEVVTAFLGGSENVSSSTLHELEAYRFHAAKLVGRLANICADLPSAHLQGTSMFLRITGGDVIPAERKFAQPFDFRPFCRLVFSANRPPRSNDSTDAFFRRWLVVPFTATFGAGGRPARDREELVAELLDASELSGALNRAVAGLRALRARGSFQVSSAMADAAAEFRQTTDPLAVWLEQELVRGPGLYVVGRDLAAAYARECTSHDRDILSEETFGRELRKHIPGLKGGQKTIGGERKRVWLGIALRSRRYSDHDVEAAGYVRE
jgi:putative DNA primase/helicase